MIELDGSAKSGSGTLLRHAVSLATMLGEELHMWNIRAKREKPGLRPQHYQAVLACQDMCQATVTGAEVGSMEIRYKPGKIIKGGSYNWDIGTGGSTTMLAMTLLPLACFAPEATTLRIVGGLFQDFAPSAYHIQHVLLPTLAKMGIQAEVAIERPGYAELGGGIIRVKVEPVKVKIKPLQPLKAGEIKEIRGIALASHLKQAKVSDRMAQECARRLRNQGYQVRIEAIYDDTALHAGAALAIWAEAGNCRFGFDQAGRKGRRAESIGNYVASNFLQDIRAKATVDRYLADQLIIYGALADGITEYIIPSLTEHVEANLWLVEHILGKFGAVAELTGNRLKIKGIGYTR